MEQSEELKDILFYQQVDLAKKDKIKKRVKLATFLTFLFLLVITFSILGGKNFKRTLFKNKEAKEIIKPVPDYLLEKNFKTGELEKKIKAVLDKLGLKIKKIEQKNETEVEIYTEDMVILINQEKELEQQLASLQVLLERFKIEGRRIKKIDLRFKSPVVE